MIVNLVCSNFNLERKKFNFNCYFNMMLIPIFLYVYVYTIVYI